MSSRSMTITLSNWVAGIDLGFGNARASEGPAPSAVPVQVAPGQATTVTAVNPSGGCRGSFNLRGGGIDFAVDYVHPSGAGATTVSVSATTGFLSGANAQTFPGHDSVAQINLYRGVMANYGWAVPLGLLAQPPRNNCQDFVNSMFGQGMRDARVVTTAYGHPAPDGYVLPADFTGGQMAGFTALWAGHWLGQGGACPPQDAALLDVLARYVATASAAGPLAMWVPQIAWREGTSPSVFDLAGYRAYPFMADGQWNAATVQAFLALLAAGAHFVAVSADKDMPTGVATAAFDTFFTGAGLPTSHDIGNSHYATVTNVTGTYYLSVGDDFAPAGCGLILAFLAGRTVNDAFAAKGTYNTFIQLEGWQAGTSRHGADYDTYKKTLWNISTFGSCPYSEKRATTIFLAPPGWTPQLYQTTLMMPYVGAYANANGSPQGWLHTELVGIPADAPALPSRYRES
ncbi:hypothetical protein [Frateuria sp. Soil773]|uniref:hypothetical protein n=1 Tax=Frateuria sp. Soil773 TaxID=1736407 RepID=UPI000AD14569|nr:hypothetical protein [Frateuria sp. Soil773]